MTPRKAALAFQKLLLEYGAEVELRDHRWLDYSEPKNVFTRDFVVMKESDVDKESFRGLADLVVKTHQQDIAKINANAKAAMKILKDSCPGITDEILLTFMISLAYMMAYLMELSLGEAFETMETIFDNYVLASASMLGVYNLDAKIDTERENHLEKLYEDLLKRKRQQVDPTLLTGQYL